ncbi:MAG: hypothetical protein H8E40_01950 [Chloroflexi bacterium]|nr:hypothetical protein [Chloroflexota bacterium]MBL7061138.1 hypothetical protein [Dehalococcoidia bacterium]
MAEGLYSNDFSRVFSELIDKTGASCYKISEYAHLDQAYISRLRNGGRNNPSAEIVMRIGLALAHFNKNITATDIEKLFNSVGRSIGLKR